MKRVEARELGHKTYQGKPCKHGHDGQRFVSNSYCVGCGLVAAAKARDADPEGVRNRFRAYYQQNREKKIAYQAAWRRANLDRYNLMMRGRSKAVRQATPKWLTKEQRKEIREIYATCPEGHEVDHEIPVQGKNVCGLHVPWNLRHLPMLANRQKSNRL